MKLFDLGKVKGVNTVSELESMYLSGQPEYTDKMMLNQKQGEMHKRNKYFNMKGGGSVFDASNDSLPTNSLLVVDHSSEGERVPEFDINNVKPLLD